MSYPEMARANPDPHDNVGAMSTFDLYFASLAGWTLHPGYLKPGSPLPPTLQQLADLANQMMDIRNGRMGSRNRGSLLVNRGVQTKQS